MIRIGRYGIEFGRTFWFQTRGPTRGRRFLCFLFFKEARSTDVDKEPQFPPGTEMLENGRRYYYWRAPKNMKRGEVVVGCYRKKT